MCKLRGVLSSDLVDVCVAFVEKRLFEEGIYRQSGQKPRVDELRKHFEDPAGACARARCAAGAAPLLPRPGLSLACGSCLFGWSAVAVGSHAVVVFSVPYKPIKDSEDVHVVTSLMKAYLRCVADAGVALGVLAVAVGCAVPGAHGGRAGSCTLR